MKITDLNRDGGIGANSFLVELGAFRLLVDCGLHPKKAGREAMPDFRLVDGREVDYLLLTHCHLDHVGALPVVMRNHPGARVLLSQPSQTLAPRMLHNSVNIMSRQRDEEGISEYPLYTHGEIERLRPRSIPMPFYHPRVIDRQGEELEITFFPAGHVPGAAGIRLVYRHRAIFFTGDCLFTPQKIVPGGNFPKQHFDTLITETTRGASPRAGENSRQSEIDRFVRYLGSVLSHGGKVLIPAFAFGRMQEVLAILDEARQARRLPACTIFCSGLGLDLSDYFDEIARKTGLIQFRKSILKSLGVKPLPEHHDAARDRRKAVIYLLSSGMMTPNTPSYTTAAGLIGAHTNAVCFVGYCDPDTPGGTLLRAKPGDSIVFPAIPAETRLQAHIERFDLSSHADRQELASFATAAEPRAVILTHGEAGARGWFSQALASQAPGASVLDPLPLQTYQI